MSSRFQEIDRALSRPTINCKLCEQLENLEREDVEYIHGLLTSPQKANEHVARVLNEGGLEISAKTVARCRKQQHTQKVEISRLQVVADAS